MKLKRNNLIKLLVTFLTVLCLVSVSGIVVHAAESTVSTQLTVRQQVNYSGAHKPPVTEFNYVLRQVASGDEALAPVSPERTFALKGSDSLELELKFDRAGIYQYTLAPAADQSASNYSLDKAEYKLQVFVENTGDGLKATLIIKNKDGAKCGSICYTHEYTGGVVDPPKTGDSSNLSLWLLLLLLALCGMLYSVLRRKKIGGNGTHTSE